MPRRAGHVRRDRGDNEQDQRSDGERPRIERFDVVQQSLEQPREHACRDQPCGDADGDEAQRLAEHEAKHRGRRRAEGHADADFLRSLPHRVRHHAVDTDRRERERDEREHAEQHRNRAWTRDRAADDIFERPDVRPALPVPSSERLPSRWSRATSDPAGCARRTVMPRPGRCVLGMKMVWRTGPSSDDLMLPTTPTTIHSMSSLPLAWSTLIRRRRPSGSPSGNCCLTSSSLTIATGTESTVSDAEKSRPASCGIPIVLKNPGVIGRTWLDDSWPSAGFGRSTRQKLVPMHANGTGRHEAPAAC